MSKNASTISFKIRWKADDSKIYHTNVFQIFYTPYSCTLYVGLIDPDKMLPLPRNVEKPVTEIKNLGRFSMDFEGFQRLKNEVDNTYKKLKELGALKNAK